MPSNPVFINGKLHDWAAIQIVMLGNPVVAITDVSWTVDRDSMNHYGAGDYPIGYGNGNVKFSGGSMNLYFEEVAALALAAPAGKITRIPPFTISIIIQEDGGVPTIIKLFNVRLLNNPFGSKQGDTNITKKINFAWAGGENVE